MRIDTDLTQADFRAYNRAMNLRALMPSWCWRRFVQVAAACFLLALAIAAAKVFLGIPTDATIEIRVLAVVLFPVLFIYFVLAVSRHLTPDESGTVLGPRTYEVTDEGIATHSLHEESLVRWSGVRELRDTGSHLLVMIDRNAAVIIPKRSLDSTAGQKELADLVSTHTGEHRREEPPPVESSA